jgi:hypothetical protein
MFYIVSLVLLLLSTLNLLQSTCNVTNPQMLLKAFGKQKHENSLSFVTLAEKNEMK